METKKPYTPPVLEELGRLHDVTGGSIFDIVGGIFGGGAKPKPGPRGSF